MDAAAESGRNPVSTHKVQRECGEQTGCHRTGQPNLSCETKFSDATGDREILIFPVQLIMATLLAVNPHSAIICDDLITRTAVKTVQKVRTRGKPQTSYVVLFAPITKIC